MKVVGLVLLSGLLSVLLVVSGCSAKPKWTEDEVTFVADGLTLHGTYRHQPGAAGAPAALLISESGPTDRNGDNKVVGPVGNMRQLAEYLSEHGVASLRYDKIGTGATGLGPYAGKGQEVGSAVYTSGAKAAIEFLAGQSGTDKSHISVYAVGEGTLHAMALATNSDPGVPAVHSLALLQPLPGRYLDLITGRVRASVAAAVKTGEKTPEQADSVVTAWNAAVDQARSQGTLPPGPLPDGLSAQLNPGNVKAVIEADAIDPLALAATIPAGTPVLLTCSDSDGQSRCTDIKPLADALAHTQLTLLQLKGVNHVLRDDPTDNLANYATPGPLSPQLTAALDTFVTK